MRSIIKYYFQPWAKLCMNMSAWVLERRFNFLKILLFRRTAKSEFLISYCPNYFKVNYIILGIPCSLCNLCRAIWFVLFKWIRLLFIALINIIFLSLPLTPHPFHANQFTLLIIEYISFLWACWYYLNLFSFIISSNEVALNCSLRSQNNMIRVDYTPPSVWGYSNCHLSIGKSLF